VQHEFEGRESLRAKNIESETREFEGRESLRVKKKLQNRLKLVNWWQAGRVWNFGF